MRDTTASDQDAVRKVRPVVNTDKSVPRFVYTITRAEQTDTVALELGRISVLPIVFVPGVMGSNLKSKAGKEKTTWRLDSALGILFHRGSKDAGARQRDLHPDSTKVDVEGKVPEKVAGLFTREQFIARGWGEVGAMSYQEFLTWLEAHLHGSSSARSSHCRLSKMARHGSRKKTLLHSMRTSENQLNAGCTRYMPVATTGLPTAVILPNVFGTESY